MVRDVGASTEFYKSVFNVQPFMNTVSFPRFRYILTMISTAHAQFSLPLRLPLLSTTFHP